MTTEVEQRAEEARQVLENPAFKEAFYPMQVRVIEDISATDIADRDRLYALAIKLQAIEEFREELLSRIEDLQLEERPAEFEIPGLH